MDPCVEAILCSLAPPVVSALTGFLAPYRLVIQVQVATARAQLAGLEIVLAPITLLQSTAEAALDAVRSAATVLPLELIEGCANLGDLNLGFERVVAPKVAEAQAFLDDLKRWVSLKEEIEAIIIELEALDAFFSELLDVIAGCGVA